MKDTQLNPVITRLQRLASARSGPVEIVDLSPDETTASSPRLTTFSDLIGDISPGPDALILTQRQVDMNAELIENLSKTHLLVRLDRLERCAEDVRYGAISDCDLALFSGADGVLTSYVPGLGDDVEMASINHLTTVIGQSKSIGLPVIVEINFGGEDLESANVDRAVEMSVSFVLELGADGVLIPQVSVDIFKKIGMFCPLPILVHSEKSMDDQEIPQADPGYTITGFVVGQDSFVQAAGDRSESEKEAGECE